MNPIFLGLVYRTLGLAASYGVVYRIENFAPCILQLPPYEDSVSMYHGADIFMNFGQNRHKNFNLKTSCQD